MFKVRSIIILKGFVSFLVNIMDHYFCDIFHDVVFIQFLRSLPPLKEKINRTFPAVFSSFFFCSLAPFVFPPFSVSQDYGYPSVLRGNQPQELEWSTRKRRGWGDVSTNPSTVIMSNNIVSLEKHLVLKWNYWFAANSRK